MKPFNRFTRASVLAVFFCFGFFSVYASENFSSADLIEGKSWAVSVYGRGADTKPKVKVSGTSSIQVPVVGGNSTVFSSGNTEIEMEQRVSEVVAALEFRPRDGLAYRFKVGQVQDYDLEFSSGSQTNKLQATKDGLVIGFGVSGGLAPGSIVSAAINWDLSYTRRTVGLDKFQGGAVVYASDERLRQDEFQGSLGFSRRWKMIEPFAGLKLARVVTRLQDNGTKEQVSGNKDSFIPYAGLQWMVAERESVIVEASFLDEKSVTAGFKVQF